MSNCSRFFLFYISTLLFFDSCFCFAAKNLPSLKTRERVSEISIVFPEEYPFFQNGFVNRNLNDKIVRPFVLDDYVVVNRRYSSNRFSDVNIIIISYYRSYDDKVFNLEKSHLEKSNIVLEREEPKLFGHKGVLYLLREHTADPKIDYMRWVAVFGDHIQTAIVAAIFPSDLEQKLSDSLRRIIEYATFVHVVEKPKKGSSEGGGEGDAAPTNEGEAKGH